MNIYNKLQDPQIVADFQHYFGVRLKPSVKRERFVKEGSTSTLHGYSKIPEIRKRDLKFSKNHNFPVSQEYSIKDGPTESISSVFKTHNRQESTGSDVSTAGDNSWKGILFGENCGGTEGSMEEEDSEDDAPCYEITNKFWFHLFNFATNLGDELFYSVFFCFWAWNVDGAVLRRVIVIWMITMYIGQALKDILKVPRPVCPPVIRLDTKWALEYGLPSTHAMVAASMPFSLLILTLDRYQLNWIPGLILAIVWCTLVCLSRLYLGMHSVLDILSGLLLSTLLMFILLPWADTLDHFALTHPASPLLSIVLTISMVVCYPTTDRWTPARGDTTVIVGVGAGSLLGSWLNYQMGIIREPSLPPPYTVIWPTLNMFGLSMLRTILGLVLIVAVRAIFKSLTFATICTFLQITVDDYKNKLKTIPEHKRVIVELFYKFITYCWGGFIFAHIVPLVFRFMGIERPTFSTEV